MHSASIKFPPVEELPTADLLVIVARAPQNFLMQTPREKDALRELRKRNS